MTAVDQTIFFDDPKRPGNCLAACVATVCDLPLASVPHFIDFGIALGDDADPNVSHGGDHWWAMLLGFMAGRGLWLLNLDHISDTEPYKHSLVIGMSPRGVSHVVVYQHGEMWHDPHPSRDGLIDVRAVWGVWPHDSRFDHEPTPVGGPNP